MVVYLGSSNKLNIVVNNVPYKFNLFSAAPITNGIRLLSSENYILKDSNGLYLTAKESE